MPQSTFTAQVYKICDKIPKGKVLTYGKLAELAGSPKAARAVGTAMKHNPNAPHTPCHRVVASDGSLAGYSGPGGLLQKLEMLKEEGVLLRAGKVDLKNCLWDGK